jgi:uncharacterized membrane protein YdbT with pleckstrin-like domain
MHTLFPTGFSERFAGRAGEPCNWRVFPRVVSCYMNGRADQATATSTPMSTTPEETIWEGNPSHAINFWLNLSCLLILPIPWALWRWIELRNHRIQITSQRVRLTTGIFSKKTEELELYRVRDITFVQPFLLRLFGKGNIVLTSSDASSPSMELHGLPADQALRDNLRRAIEACRDRKRARVAEWTGDIDIDTVSPG